MKIVKPLITVILLAAAAGGIFYFVRMNSVRADENPGIAVTNGRLELKRYTVQSRYPGRIVEMKADRGDVIKKGDVIAVLEDNDTMATLRSAEAQKKSAGAAKERIHAQRAAAETELSLRETELADAKNLMKEKLISSTELKKRDTAVKAKRQEITSLKKAEAAAAADEERASAEIEKVRTVIDDLSVRSPVDGHVEYRLADPGNVISSGSRVMAVLDPLDVTMDVFLPSKDAVKVKVGDEARIVIDGVDAVFPAKVDFVADDAQFTPKFVETREERDKLRFRVILKVSPDTAAAHPRYLKGGMPAVAYLRTDNASWPGNLAVKLPEESAGKSQAASKD